MKSTAVKIKINNKLLKKKTNIKCVIDFYINLVAKLQIKIERLFCSIYDEEF